MPSTKAAGRSTRRTPKQAPQAKPETAPAAPVKDEGNGMFDNEQEASGAGNGVSTEGPTTSDGAPAGDGNREEAPASPAPAPAHQDEGDKPEADAPAPTATSQEVRLGHITCVQNRVPTEVVQELLADRAERVGILRSSPTIADLQERLRASEGRCAPIFFTMDETDEEPKLISGIETLAAALNLGLSAVSVVMIPAGDAGAAQAILASQNARPQSAETDDDLVMQVMRYHDRRASPA